MSAAFKISRLGALVSVLIIAGCAASARRPAPTPQSAAIAAQPAIAARAYQVVASESLLTVRVYRAGTFARAGHNHIIASHDLAGVIYAAKDLEHSSFELVLPVAALTVDESELRAAEGADFAADVPDSAREGTRRNMLGPAVLDADHYAQITLHSAGLQVDADHLDAEVEVHIRGQMHTVTAAVSYTLTSNELLVQGELPLKQTDLGLAPFTALLGALQVQDEMKLKFRIVARAQD